MPGAGDAERALALLGGDEPTERLLRARALADLERREEGLREYRAAVEVSPALEDLALQRRLSATVVDFRGGEGRPRLRVISNDDTDKAETTRLLTPSAETLTFDDVGGLDELKKTIHKKIILPYQKPGLFQRFRKRVGGGILLTARRAAARPCWPAPRRVSARPPSSTSPFPMCWTCTSASPSASSTPCSRKPAKAPAVLFFDEVEALGGRRTNTREATSSKLVSQFLTEMDGFAQSNHGVLILAATNVPWSVDAAFRRPGRFDRVLFVPPPDRPHAPACCAC